MTEEITTTTDSFDIAEILHAEYAGKELSCDARVLGKSQRKAFPLGIIGKCRRCGSSVQVDLAKDELAFWHYLKGDMKQMRVLASLSFPEPCIGGGIHTVGMITETPAKQDYRVLKVDSTGTRSNDPLYTVHLIGKRSPGDQEHTIRFHGRVVQNPKTQDLEFLAHDYSLLKDSRQSFTITAEDCSFWSECFGRDKVVHLTIAPGIKGETRDLGKLIHAITAHSVTTIPDPFDPSKSVTGTIRAGLVGATTLGKTDTAKSFSDADPDASGNHYSKYVNAESASRTGLSYAIDAESKMIIWGELVLNDQGMVVLDGLDKFREEDMGQLREVLRRGHVTVTRSLKGEAPARCRILASMNPRRPAIEHYAYAAQALKDLACFRGDGTELTRFDLLVPYRDDVSPQTIARADRIKPPVPTKAWVRHVLWAQTRKPEDIVYQSEAINEIKAQSEALLSAYQSREFPLINNGVTVLLTKVGVAFACLYHSADQTHEKVVVTQEIIADATSFIIQLLKAWDIDRYIAEVERPSALLPTDYIGALGKLDIVDYVVLAQLSERPRNSSELEEFTGLKAQTIRQEHFSKLTSLGLVSEGPSQKKQLTPKGAQFFRGISSLGTIPRSVESSRKTLQGSLDSVKGVELDSTALHPGRLSLAERAEALRRDHQAGLSYERLVDEYGLELVIREKIPKIGGHQE
jgi:hypothetical protein